jgi:hypothetical protein
MAYTLPMLNECLIEWHTLDRVYGHSSMQQSLLRPLSLCAAYTRKLETEVQ